MTYINPDFLLNNTFAKRLYHEYAAGLPIIDYHNHLYPQTVSENKNFETISDVWLSGDHYKWRAMRWNGINEKFITGSASSAEKFQKWAETVPSTLRNPLYHWTHLELKRYFGIDDLLSLRTADRTYSTCNELLQNDDFKPLGLLQKMKVEVICTTDDPVDNLAYHTSSLSQLKMLPTFRPDRFIRIDLPAFVDAIKELSHVTGKNIEEYDDLIHCLYERIESFHTKHCKLSDHGLSAIPVASGKQLSMNTIFKKAASGQELTADEIAHYQHHILLHLAEKYHEKNWTMQLHLGAIRNNNLRLKRKIGADVGCDSIGDYKQAEGLSQLLGTLDDRDKLPKTILYNLNPADNEVFATMAGNFNDGSIKGKIQWGSAWWFLDQKDGMEKQINTLSNMGLLSRFIGMLTDSRSFLSFPRHEYFRRILCNLVGADVKSGSLPNDEKLLGEMVSNICYYNAKEYFNF